VAFSSNSGFGVNTVAQVPAARPATASQALPRVAVVGCGYWGKNLVRNFSELGALAAICDPDQASADRLASAYPARVIDWQALRHDADIDAVAIAAPAALHYRLARAALDNGKHVFVEKPLALDVAEAEQLCELAGTAGRCLMVGHLLQYHPAFLKLKEMVHQGVLGRLQYLYSNRLNLGKIRREEDILWSFAPHDISMILALVGADPERVTAEGGNYLHKSIADVTTTHMAFPGGEQAHIFVSWLHPFKEQKLIVVGDRGMAVFNDAEPWERKLVMYRHRIEWRGTVPVPEKADAEAVVLDVGEPLRLECQHFLDSILNGTPPRTGGEEGLRVLRVLTTASASLKRIDAATVAQPDAKLARSERPDVKVHATACVDEPVEIGAGTRIWHFSHVLPRSRIGKNCILGQNVMVGPDVTIGDNCKFQNNVSVYPGVTIEDGVFCGPSCVFTNVINPRAEIERKSEFRTTLVRRGATIGANATIVCGHTLGEYCMIGAGAVVTRDVPAFALMVGSPARRVGWMSRAGVKLGKDLVCPIDGSIYRETAPNKLELVEEGTRHG
jgi:predicted dehydrogenase/carbonic anhydrase/acetyltransferase-like protein (isoleucine patch superfamily)